MRTVPLVALALAVAAAAAAVAFVPPAGAGSPADDPNFEGFVVEQAGEVRTYPQADGWEAIPDVQSFSLDRRGLRITYYGDFVAEERKATKRGEPHSSTQKVGTAFTVVAGGKTRHYRSEEGWNGSRNISGLYLQRRGQTVWFYGTARVEEPR